MLLAIPNPLLKRRQPCSEGSPKPGQPSQSLFIRFTQKTTSRVVNMGQIPPNGWRNLMCCKIMKTILICVAGELEVE
jgi:hypothetical protein